MGHVLVEAMEIPRNDLSLLVHPDLDGSVGLIRGRVVVVSPGLISIL